jgi:hypothetical protein
VMVTRLQAAHDQMLSIYSSRLSREPLVSEAQFTR